MSCELKLKLKLELELKLGPELELELCRLILHVQISGSNFAL